MDPVTEGDERGVTLTSNKLCLYQLCTEVSHRANGGGRYAVLEEHK